MTNRAFIVLEHPSKGYLLLHGKGKWQLPGGHADGKESLLETAVRETREETGIEVPVSALRTAVVVDKRAVYVAGMPQKAPQVRLSDEHELMAWVPFSGLKRVWWLDSKSRGKIKKAFSRLKR